MAETERVDVVIIGAGPAGLSAAVYCGRALMDTVVIEKNVVGGQILEAYDVDNYPGFDEGITGPELVDKMQKHAERFGARMVQQNVEDIVHDGRSKRVVTDEVDYCTPIVIVASGASHRKLDVPGEKELSGSGVSYCATCDGPFFRDKRLVVVGGGDAAVTEGLFLTRFASHLDLVHRRQGFRARPTYLKEARENEKFEFILDTVVTEIQGEGKVESVRLRNVLTGEERDHECDGVFISIGHEPNTGFLKTLLPDYAGDIVPVDFNMESDVKGLYAVGDVRVGSFRQVGTAVGEGIMAAMHAEQRLKELAAG
jgi:thioredoxin reductase (NADPH)